MKYFFLMNENIEIKFNNEYVTNNFEKTILGYKVYNSDNEKQILKVDENNFVIVLGTMIYNNKSGKEMLRNIYLDYNGNVEEIRLKSIGNYSLIIKKNDIFEVFSDTNSIHKLYYYLGEKTYICNSYYFLAKHLDSLSVDVNNLLEDSFQYAVLNNETLLKDINILSGNKKLKFNKEFRKFDLLDLEIVDRGVKIDNDLEKDAKALADLIREKAKILTRHYPKIGINLTGGLDSRLVLAAYLSVGVKPIVLYGVGNSFLTNTKKKDLELVKKYAYKFGLELKLMNWNNEGIKIDKDWEKLLYKYGEYFKLYSGNSNIFNAYDSIFSYLDLMDFGYFGEMLRNLDWIDNENIETIKNNDIFKKYFHYDMKSFTLNKDNFETHFLEKISVFSKKREITCREFQNLFILYRYSADTKMLNFSNFIGNSSILLSEPDIQSFIQQVPISFMKGKKFMLKVLYNLYKEILDIPIFSHCEDLSFDKENFLLKPLKNKNSKMKKNIKKIIEILKMKKIILIFNFFKHEVLFKNSEININEFKKKKINFENEVTAILKEIGMSSPIEVKEFDFDIRAFIEYWQNLYMIRNLKLYGNKKNQ